ncbi:MAG: translation initiation factor IF-2 [Patescibacteria group bacterium]
MSSHRQPVVAIVGHIDHGKTTLLDYIRKSRVADKEAGGITQRVSAYEIVHQNVEGTSHITFIDTPGHEAFQKMRRRSSAAADIAILIVAADDGVKPQTIEAKKAIEEAGIPYIVAFTKIDKDTANLERAKESVMREGIYLEGLGGDVPYAAVSSKTGDGIPELLDLILLVAQVSNVTCDADAPATAIVLESSRDPKNGVGATVIIKSGTVKTGTFAVSENALAPLRALENYAGKRVSDISCGKPARITGWSDEPPIGSVVTFVGTKKEAETLQGAHVVESKKMREATPENADRPAFRLVLKADTKGSLEALQYELDKSPRANVDVLTVSESVGAIGESDVKLLIGFEPAAIVGFNVGVDSVARDLAERQRIQIVTKDIIYELGAWLTDEIKKLEPDLSLFAERGRAKILKVFSESGSKHVMGGSVETGALKVGDSIQIERRGVEIGRGKILNLQLQKADVSNVPEGSTFGMQIESKIDMMMGDHLVVGGKKHT